jgi:hypothetical protein
VAVPRQNADTVIVPRRRRVPRSLILGLLALVMVPLGEASWASRAGAASPTTIATTAPMTLAQWKQQYEQVIGVLADDALVVVSDGKPSKTRLSKSKEAAKVKQTVADCTKWHKDALQAPGMAPPVPSAPVQKNWTALMTASTAASADCLTAFHTGSKSAATKFRHQLYLINQDEGLLTAELGG